MRQPSANSRMRQPAIQLHVECPSNTQTHARCERTDLSLTATPPHSPGQDSLTRDPLGFGAHVSDSVVLIDGQRLRALMLEAGVGVSHYRTLKMARIDDDYFEDE